MSDFHGRVMNIECNMSASICRPAEDTALAYKYGHRDARHAAAEIANEADRAIRDSGATIAAKDSEIARLRDVLGKIAKGRTGLDPEESDAEWRAYWASLCINYRSMARAALAGGGA